MISKSLTEFGKDLQKYNINLEIFNSDEINFFSKINKEKDLSVYWNKIYEPEELEIDKKLISFFEKKKINFKFFKGNVLNEFNKVNKNDGTPFKVYSPFWRNAERIYLEKVPEKNSIIKKLKKSKNFFSGSINSDKILPKKNWYKKFENYWIPSETQAETNLNQFIKNEIGNYGVDRDFPSKKGTSKLSPFIRNGQISVQNIFEKCSNIKQKNISIKKYINEIGWREFSHSLINNFPQMLKGNLRKEFDRFPWVKNSKFLKAWKRGMTGYPIVDAGMRELYETGWMHNRIRMVVGSFLVKHLRINWQEEKTF